MSKAKVRQEYFQLLEKDLAYWEGTKSRAAVEINRLKRKIKTLKGRKKQ